MKQSHIRNFAIIAHIDHGKSTLSDRLLELTQTISKDKLQEQFLDQNPISRERGITIKLAPVRMKYHYQQLANSPQQAVEEGEYILNLIDTPGHVDFSYEVSRTLAACEGAVLLVDATQGIQAQTVAHFQAAKKEGLVMIPVINKIDLPNAMTDEVTRELIDIFGFQEADIIYISAKTGENVDVLLHRIIEKFPPPVGDPDAPLRALIFDAVYDEFRGVVAYIRIIDGSIKTGDSVQLYQSKVQTTVSDVGHFTPYLVSSKVLETGEIGYLITGVKNIRESRVGDTVTSAKFKAQNEKLVDERGNIIEPLPGYTIPKPMVFFGMYPRSSDDFVALRDSLGKLVLNDTALTFTEEYSAYLGSGFRVGFLGLLHAEIVKQRLEQEFGLEILLTMPQVLYDKKEDGTIFEPYMLLTIYVPTQYVGGVMSVAQKHKGSMLDLVYHDTYAVLTYEMPYSMFIRGLSAELKSVSSGYASMDYELVEYRPANLVNVTVRINDNDIDVLSELAYKDEAQHRAEDIKKEVNSLNTSSAPGQ
jgi:GTP-binding protein LepA